MNFELGSEEQQLIDAVRDALSRTDTLGAARAALDGAEPMHLWKEAVRGGWIDMPGLLYSVLVLIECGRRLAPTGLVGHLSALAALRPDVPEALLDGSRRAAIVFDWGIKDDANATSLMRRAEHVPDAFGADVLVIATDAEVSIVDAGFEVEPVGEYDKSRPIGNVRYGGTAGGAGEAAVGGAAAAARVEAPGGGMGTAGSDAATGSAEMVGGGEYAWNTAQTLLAAEALGAAEAALAMAVEYAKQRKAFGRSIGSFQAVKHQLADALRLNENARSLLYFAAYASENDLAQFGLAANAARFAADQAVDVTTRRCLAVHGGLGATWEHDAHLYFRRAQLTRLLLGGQAGAGERVVRHVLG